jgi:hypothetical protein
MNASELAAPAVGACAQTDPAAPLNASTAASGDIRKPMVHSPYRVVDRSGVRAGSSA